MNELGQIFSEISAASVEQAGLIHVPKSHSPSPSAKVGW